LPAWWWLIRWLGLPDLSVVVVNGEALNSVVGLGFCRLGFLDFAGWVWVHGVVVVDGLGLGLPISAWLVLQVAFSVDFLLGLGFCRLGLIGFCRLGLGSRRGGG
jgi:hypothetical protein